MAAKSDNTQENLTNIKGDDVKQFVKRQSLMVDGFVRNLTEWVVPDLVISIITLYIVTDYSIARKIKLKDQNGGKSLGLDLFYDKDTDGDWSFVMAHVYAHAIFEMVLVRYIDDHHYYVAIKTLSGAYRTPKDHFFCVYDGNAKTRDDQSFYVATNKEAEKQNICIFEAQQISKDKDEHFVLKMVSSPFDQANGYYLCISDGSVKSDYRDCNSFYVIVHRDRNKATVFKMNDGGDDYYDDSDEDYDDDSDEDCDDSDDYSY